MFSFNFVLSHEENKNFILTEKYKSLASPGTLNDSGFTTDTSPSESRGSSPDFGSPTMGLEQEQAVHTATVINHKTQNGSIYQIKPIDKDVIRENVVAEIESGSPILPKPKMYLKGPDQIIPAENYKTTEASGAVKLKIGERGVESIPPISVPTLLARAVERYTDRVALAVKREGKWQEYTYRAYLQNVRTVAKAFIRLGLEPFHGVCILGFNSPEWFFANLAAIHAGGLAAGIYTTNSPESILHCAKNCKANIFVVEDKKQLAKVLQIKDQLPHLKHIIQYSDNPDTEVVISWSQLINLGNSCSDSELDERLKRIAVNQCCTMIYTSGTTGNPKGVMLSHDNLTWNGHAVATYVSCKEQEIMISFLPLSHVAAQIVDIYAALSVGASIYFASPDALKGSLVNTLKEVRPTIFFGVPRVWEKIHEKMMEIGSQTKGWKRTIATWAKDRGTQYNKNKMDGFDSKPFGFFIAEALVFGKVRAALGLDRTRYCFSGAAPLSLDVINYFASLDIPVYEVYGMSESTGPHTVNIATSFCFGSAGRTLSGSKTVIHQPDKDGNGEICMGGRDVFMGYLDDEPKTNEAIHEDGLLHSGDIGKVDSKGFLFITGRIKELLITAGGENVPPVLIEDNVKAELPCVSNAMLIGDKRKFLSILLTLKTLVDPESQEPLDELTPAVRSWFKEMASVNVATITDIRNLCKDVNSTSYKAVNAGLIAANAKAISNAQKIQKWTLLPKDFSVHGGELGPTLKLKRAVVYEKYAPFIEEMYQ
ncbi:long-chain-fatty-acid--CoA ligase ACSBG2-like isoform X2 [Artemia franciscana]|uniref:long-chain-fatty-acid--CoA ligase ACSBG2-like isoform X2 n=1 Tax=Artemia franciscana TaxID=6661 RepID=UPI0032DBAB01